MLRVTLLAAALLAAFQAPRPDPPSSRHELRSPDGRTLLVVETGSGVLRWSLMRDEVPLLAPSLASLTVSGQRLGREPAHVLRSRADERVASVFYARRSVVRDHYEGLTLSFSDRSAIAFRAYNDAVAYRWTTSLPGDVRIDAEEAQLRFPGDPTVYAAFADCEKAARHGADCFHSSFEEPYAVTALSAFPRDRQAFLPVLVNFGAGRKKLLVTESDLDDYPGLWLRSAPGATSGLDAVFPAFPVQETVTEGEFPQAVVKTRAAHIAETSGTREYPWRVVVTADTDAALAATDVVYRLGGETGTGDWSWLRPGKSQSEWLWDNILYDVPFVSGMNNDTYRSYIDFARQFGTGYVFFDAGWSKVTDPLSLTPGLDVPALVREARSKGVGVVLWTLALAVDRNIDAVMDQLRRWGATGIMVDFMDRDDQPMVRFYRRVAEAAARRQLLVNFHGAYKPTGLERRFPNAATREGLIAFEYDKWSDVLTPEYEVTVPFIRGVVGPADYEPGSMRNAQRSVFKPMGPLPMSQGTRMHQAAMYLVYESPYAKMGGNVSDYRREPEFTKFLASIPTLWKETRVLEGRVGDYIVVLRETADGSFWVGAMTDWTARDLEVSLSSLPSGSFTADVWQDGPNAARYGADWTRATRVVTGGERLTIRMAPGGGFVAHLTRSGSR